MKKRFLNPEIDVLWFDEEELLMGDSGTGNTGSTDNTTTVTNPDTSTEVSSQSFTTIIKASNLQK